MKRMETAEDFPDPPANSNSDSGGKAMPHMNKSCNDDSVYKIYLDAGTLPSKNSATEHDSSKPQKSLGGVTDTHELSSVTIIGPPTRPETLYSSEASNVEISC